MIKPDLIIRTNRRSLSLTISKTGELIVRAPKRLSAEYIFAFIKQKEKWIINKQKQINNTQKQNSEILNLNEFLFCGNVYNKIEVSKIKDIEISDGNILFPVNLSQEKIIGLSLKWYKNLTYKIVENRLIYFANLMQINYENFGISNSKNKWGSCNLNGDLQFNLRISMLPHKIIDYIVVHELTHLIEFSHSKNFYRIIESIMPEYNDYRHQLKTYNYLLQLLR
jgi:predicted metal-dependent hydrolase